MSTPDDSTPPPAIRQWPQGPPLDAASAMRVDCPDCSAPWQVHRDLAGFRLQCSCGAWITMPARVVPTTPMLPAEAPAVGLPAELVRDDQGRIELPLKPGEVSDEVMPVSAAMAPGTVRRANVRTQQRWTNSAILELALMMVAFLSPWVFVSWFLEGQARTLALPFTSMATGIAVVLIAAVFSPYAFTGLRRAGVRHFAEAALGAMLLAGLAMLWMDLLTGLDDVETDPLIGLRKALGDGWALFVIALCPALFEELAFRGVVQGRFTALLGRYQGIIATGAAFGLCHGVTAGLPFHIGIGIWLCFLRERSKSLLPGMLAHFLYNGMLVITA